MQQTKWTSVIVHADLEHLRRVPRNVLPVLGKHKRMLVCIEMDTRERLSETYIKMITGSDHIIGPGYNIRDGVLSSFPICYCNCSISDDYLNATDTEDSDVETEMKEFELC